MAEQEQTTEREDENLLEPSLEAEAVAEGPRVLVDTIRPQTEEMRRARVALRDAEYRYEVLGIEQLRVLAQRLAPEENPEMDTKTGLIAALKKASIR